MFIQIHLWAVLAAGIVACLARWAWYSPVLWQKPWLAARGETSENRKNEKSLRVDAYSFLNTFAEAFVIAVFLALTGVTTLIGSLQVALLLCFGFVVTVKFNDLLYTAHPPHWGKNAQLTFLIDVGYQIVLFMMVSSIIWWLSLTV